MNDSRLRIMLLGDARSFHLERYLSELKRQNCEVLFLSLESGYVPHVLLKSMGPIKFLHYYLSVSELKSKIREFAPDVVDAHYVSGYGHLAARALKQSAVPLVVQMWGSDILIVPKKSWLHKRKVELALSECDIAIGDSDYLICEACKIKRPKLTANIQFGVEEQFLKLHKQSYELKKPLRVIVPRPHEPVYDNSFILNSLAQLLKDKLIFISFPNFGSRLEDFKRQLECLNCSNVELYDKKERAEFLSFMSEHDVYLSAAKSDSSPVSLIEAMAVGLIPIAADIPGVREWLSNENGFLFARNDKNSLNKILSGICSAQNNYDEIRISNLLKVKERAMFEINVAERIAIMKRLVEKNVS